MSRKRNDGEGSLELLLDTICNMFGGVVLIAILLAVLSQEVGEAKAKDVVTADAAQKQRVCLAVLSNKLERVNGELANLSRVEKVPVETVSESRIEELNSLIIEKKKEKQQKEDKKDRVEEEIRKIIEKIRMLVEKEEAQTIDQTEVRVPVARKMNKSTVLVFMRNGRYFPVTKMNKDGSPGKRDLDRAVCTAGQLPGGAFISLVDGASGQLIKDEIPDNGYVNTMLRVLDKNKEMLMFVVYEDSFKEFNLLKKHVVSKGINYTWIPVKKSEKVLRFSTGASEVQGF